jgi:hypothetical protein
VDLWTTPRGVAHKPTGPTAAADNLNLEISSVRTMPGAHRSDGTYTAIYPFTQLSKIPGSIIGLDFDPVFWKQQLQNSISFRQNDLSIFDAAERLATDQGAKCKIQHYKRGLEEVIATLRRRESRLDLMIATGVIPYGGDW